MTRAHYVHSVEYTFMYGRITLITIRESVCDPCTLLRTGTCGGYFPYGDVEKDSTYQVCVWRLYLCRYVGGSLHIVI